MALLAMVIVGYLAPHPMVGAEPCREFFDGLRERGLNEWAIEYLDQMRGRTGVPADFQETIDYEKGTLLLVGLDGSADRAGRLAAAEKCLAAFVEQHPAHGLAMRARAELGRAMTERGRLLAEGAMDAERTPPQREERFLQARALYAEASQVLAVAEPQFDELQKQLSRLVARGSVRELDRRDATRCELLEIRLAQAALFYETAETYAADSRPRREGLSAAAAAYHRLYERYEQLLAGCYARLGEARCAEELGDGKQALAVLEEIFQQPDEPESFRVMKNKALALALETYERPALGDWREAVVKGRQWLASARPAELSSEEGVAIEYLTGRALLETARTRPAADPGHAAAVAESRALLESAARARGVYRQRARALLSDPLLGRNAASP
jgi:hypothetical protein